MGVAIAVGLAVASAPASAQSTGDPGPEHELVERGATREALTSVDSVNFANGGVIINIPIGVPVQVGGGLSFGLNLFYSSKVWDVESSRLQDPMDSGPVPRSFPSRKSRAGMGWSLNLGELIPPRTRPLNTNGIYWLYVDPSGGSHYFYGFVEGPEDPEVEVWYTRDSTYLRMRRENGDYHVEFPNGEVHVFDGNLQLRKIFNQFGGPGDNQNHLIIDYDQEGSLDVQIVEDWHGRRWEIHSSQYIVPWNSPAVPPVEERTIRQVHKVVVPGFGNQAAVYNFRYEEPALVLGCAWLEYDPAQRRVVPLLTRIDLPMVDGERLFWQFENFPDESGTHGDCKQGLVKRATLPSGGSIVWDYRSLDIRSHCDNGVPTFYWGKSPAVRRRWYYDVGGGDPLDTNQNDDGVGLLADWAYNYWESQPPLNGDVHPLEQCDNNFFEPASETLTVEEITPSGDRIFRPYMIWPGLGATATGASWEDHFLPYIRHGIDPRAGAEFDREFLEAVRLIDNDRFVSKAVFDCNEMGQACKPFSVDQVRYDMGSPVNYGDGYRGDRNARVASDGTIYFGADLGEWYRKTTDRSDWDGYGNYRRTESWSDFPGEYDAGSSRVVTRDYNAHRGFGYPLGASGGQLGASFQPFGSTDPWVLSTFSVTDTEENGLGSRVETHFDTDTGFLERQRVWAATGSLSTLSREPNDVVTVFEHDAEGNLNAVSTFGGDRQAGLPDQDLADLPLASWEHRRESSFIHGYRTYEAEVGRHGGSVLLKDVTVDRNTGRPVESRDATGLQTELGYDALGRLIRVTPPSDAETVAQWTPPSDTSGPIVTLVRTAEGETQRERIVQDGFERNVLEQVLFPLGQWSSTVHEYGPDGLLHRTSTPFWAADGSSSAGWTVYSDYDPLARPWRTVAPDGSESLLTVDREHAFETSSKVAIGTIEDSVSTVLFQDSRGRTVAVREHSDGATPVTTTYEYDVGERLTRVAIPRPGGGFQARRFDYDNRGFMRSESHPESGETSFTAYDSRGQVGTRTDAVNRLGYRYDEFGRLVQVWDEPAGRLLSEDFYGRDNRQGGDDYSLGKVVMSRRHNYLAGQHLIVTETYAYEDPQGRLSELRTRSNTGFDVAQAFAYDRFGNLDEQWYPFQDLLPEEEDPDRRLVSEFEQSRLVGLTTALAGVSTGVVDSVTYHPHGSVAARLHANDVSDRVTVDASGMGRPGRMWTTGVAGGEDWDSGSYGYDGSGNVKAIGSTQSFTYDRAMRLRTARVEGVDQAFGYDRFGNLVNLAGRSLPVQASTNRLLGFDYDGAGRVLTGGGFSFSYDAAGMVSSSGDYRFVYGVDDERIAVIAPDGSERWTLRDPLQRIVREYSRPLGGGWVAERDYLYGNRLVASLGLAGGSTPVLERYYHSDHLGSPQLITDGAGGKVSDHTYLPFGEELDPGADGERFKFTGQERDFAGLDYFHARYYGPLLGRFLSADPINSGRPSTPQSWNKYSYSLNNPLVLVDPDGKCAVPAGLLEGRVGICVESFIAAKRIGGFGFGDNRGFEPHDPDATFRSSLRMTMNPESGEILFFSEEAGVSEVGLFGPIMGIPGVTDVQGTIAPGEDGSHNLSVSITADNGFSAVNWFGEIGIQVNLKIDGQGNVSVDSSSTTKGYPSIEGYAYRIVDGKLVIETLFQVKEKDSEDLKGLMDQPLIIE